MTTKTTEKPSLEIKRFIKAPRHRVYAAWTDPAALRQWFGPEGVQTHNLIAETRGIDGGELGDFGNAEACPTCLHNGDSFRISGCTSARNWRR